MVFLSLPQACAVGRMAESCISQDLVVKSVCTLSPVVT